jgi:hypothetical protein
MKSKDITIGGTYLAKVGGRVVPVRVTAEFEYGTQHRTHYYSKATTVYRTGWLCTNTLTGREIRVRSAVRFRGAVGTTTEAGRC